MLCNIGKFDKVLRRSFGLIIIGLGIYYKSWYGALGLIPLGLSWLSHCPLYLPFGINTKKEKTENA